MSGTEGCSLAVFCNFGGPLLAQEWMSMIIPTDAAAATRARRRQ